MAEFIAPDIEPDPQAIELEIESFLQARWPNWTPADGNLETWLNAGYARIAAELAQLALDVPTEIFKLFGEKVIGLAPIKAAPSTAETTWTLSDTDGHTIPARTPVALVSPDGDTVIGFQTVDDVVIAQGDSEATGVIIQAIKAGEAANLSTGPVNLIEALGFVADNGITLDTVPSGGVEEETGSDYTNRLASELQLLSPRPILPRDFEVLSRRVAGVERALALDLYDPDTETYDNERMVTVAVVDENGLALSSDVKDEVDALLEAQREINFIVHIIDPTFTAIDVTATVKVYETFDPDAVAGDVEAALAQYLSPANWGRPPFGESAAWIQQTVVRYQEIVTLINNIPGVNHYTALTVEGGTADITLSGAAPLTQAGTIAVTGVAP